MRRDDGGSAFPTHAPLDPNGQPIRSSDIDLLGLGGMTLRDYFAGQAIGHVVAAYALANPVAVPGWGDPPPTRPGIGTDHLPRNASVIAYKIADAMIAERNKEPT